MLRITTGVNYFWEKAEIFGGKEGMNGVNAAEAALSGDASQNKTSQYSNFAIFKLAPQLSLPAGWRLASNMIWCTRRHTLTPANLYAEVGVYKNIGKHLTLEGRFHDIAGQHFGNRAVTMGFTYYF